MAEGQVTTSVVCGGQLLVFSCYLQHWQHENAHSYKDGMARNHMTQLTVTVDVMMLFLLISIHSAGSNLLVHSTEWHLEESEV